LYLDWDLTAQNNLNISGVEFNDRSFLLGIFQAAKLDPQLKKILNSDAASEWLFVARWPKPLLRTGTLEALSRSGQVLWHQSLEDSDFDHWSDQQNQWRKLLKARKFTKDEIENMPIMHMNVALRNFNMDIQPFWTLTEPFRLCLSSFAQDGLLTRMCSRLVEVNQLEKGQIALRPFPKVAQPARVIAFNELAKLKDSRPVAVNQTVQFYAELNSGSSFEFIAKPAGFNLVEIVEIEGTDLCRMRAFGNRPNIPVQDVAPPPKGLFERILGRAWYQTIGDFREYWEVNIPRKQPIFYIPGLGGGLFREQLNITKIPSDRIRPYVRSNSINATYVDGEHIYGKTPNGTTVSTSQNEVTTDSATNEFDWRFGAPLKGDLNKSYLSVNDGENTFRAYREIYRGYPGEVSARMTGVAGLGGSFLLLGELTGNYWFESLLGWSNYYLSRQRWGVSVKYFQSANTLSSPPVNDYLQYTTAELKYRLDPGLWSRDETWGLELGMNQVSYNFFQAQLVGGGFFWGRSMPKVFDDIMNIWPIMRYPKWVDLEWIYYPVSQTPAAILSNFGSGLGNWQLNFHGKVMWTKQLFGEAGFGIKQLDWTESFASGGPYTRLRFQLTSFYGTMGLGWSF